MLRPRQYISWSQLDLLEKSELQYKKIYIDGEDGFTNKGIELGKKIADSLESGEDTGDMINDLVISQFPKFEVMELELSTQLTIDNIKIPLLSRLDSAKKDLTAFKEYKTGITEWNQKKVDNHGQITFYCVVIQSITGKIPEDIELIYAPSIKNEKGEMELTGKIKTFKTHRTIVDTMRMKVRIKKAWVRIGQMMLESLI